MLICPRRVIDSWLEEAAAGRTNIAPEKIPWRAIRTLLSNSTYGGKIDNEQDQLALEALVDKLFTPKVFELDYLLVDAGSEKLAIPDANKLEQFTRWVEQLPEREPPVWLGLRSDAQELMLADEGQRTLSAVRSLIASLDEA